MASGEELFDCSICLQLLEDPVTTACGHSYCITCINSFWDLNNNSGRSYSCPQCRQTFSQRPVLKRNTLLAALLEENKRPSPNSTDTYASPGDVECDICTGRKRKASMFCLVCLASYCQTHLKPHFEVPPLKKHNLIQASVRVKESLCGRHDKLLEIYCRTDQLFICLMCVMDQHKGHDMVAVAAEKCEMQRRLEGTKQEIADRVLDSERKMAELREAADSIRDAAWKTCDDIERLCVERIRLFVRSVDRKRSEMRDKVGEAEKAGVDWTNSRLGQLQREVLELRRREEELDQLSLTEDPIQFFADSTVEVDPNTVAACLCLSDRSREISWGDRDQAHPDHPDRFTFYHQALCKKGLQCSHYWEVEWDGGIVDLAVSYKGIGRKGSGKDCCFGHNDLSWKLTCSPSGCTFWHNNLHKGQIPPVLSRRVGIHLDYDEGMLGFYSVESDSGSMTQLHQIQTTFTEPLYPGFSVDSGSTLKICNI